MFSVLIANYNNGRYLQEAIDSVFSQTYTDWEIVIVDDASTDNSADIYRRNGSDSRIRIFHNWTNGTKHIIHANVESIKSVSKKTV